MEELTLDNIISTLKKNGINSKSIIINALENASVKELKILGRSIQDKLVLKVKGEYRK